MKLHLTNAEVGMWNAEGWKRFAKSFLIQTEYIHSTFDVGRSMFISFFLDFTGRFFEPAVGLTPETFFTSDWYPPDSQLNPIPVPYSAAGPAVLPLPEYLYNIR